MYVCMYGRMFLAKLSLEKGFTYLYQTSGNTFDCIVPSLSKWQVYYYSNEIMKMPRIFAVPFPALFNASGAGSLAMQGCANCTIARAPRALRSPDVVISRERRSGVQWIRKSLNSAKGSSYLVRSWIICQRRALHPIGLPRVATRHVTKLLCNSMLSSG